MEKIKQQNYKIELIRLVGTIVFALLFFTFMPRPQQQVELDKSIILNFIKGESAKTYLSKAGD